MAKSDGPRPSTEDVLAAAFEANCQQWEKQTGRSREAMFAELDRIDPNAGIGARMAQDHYSEMRNR